MSLEQELIIERFLRNELSEDEKYEFFKKMEEDSDFREKVLMEEELSRIFDDQNWSFSKKNNQKEFLEYKELFESEFTTNLKASIQDARKKYEVKKIKLTRLSYAAAAVIFFIIFMYFGVGTSREENNLFEYYTSQLELPTAINRGTENNKKLIEAETLFKEKNYTQALSVFNQILEEDKSNSSIYLHIALSNIYLKNYEKAEEVLNTLIKSDLIDAEKGYWVKSLMYLRQKNKKAAKKELEYIIKQNLYNKDKAIELLEKIE